MSYNNSRDFDRAAQKRREWASTGSREPQTAESQALTSRHEHEAEFARQMQAHSNTLYLAAIADGSTEEAARDVAQAGVQSLVDAEQVAGRIGQSLSGLARRVASESWNNDGEAE